VHPALEHARTFAVDKAHREDSVGPTFVEIVIQKQRDVTRVKCVQVQHVRYGQDDGIHLAWGLGVGCPIVAAGRRCIGVAGIMGHYCITIALVLFGYLLGSVPWGVVITRRFAPHVDLRGSGSGNIGATNVRRTAGWQLGLATLAADAAKGALPVLLARLASLPDGSVALVAAAAFLGHLYPVYTGLKGGGKGVATVGGCLLVISPPALVAALVTFVAAAAAFRRVSAASLASAAVMPPALWGFGASPLMAAWAVATAGLIWIRHRENIQRLLRGTEPRV
jgi:glycerol-3-phosphate acyltransferase PlsY